MTNKNITIGLFGFGCVGQGLYDVLQQTNGITAQIEKICVKNRDKKRKLPEEYFTFDKKEILNNPDINVVVELIDDADAAFEIVSSALRNGKAVVTANKKMLAEHFQELLDLQEKYKTPLIYEGAVCASIPVIRNLEEYYDNDLLSSIEGIFNGSTNYILTKIFKEGKPYVESLKEAQELGFAESDPTLDVTAQDPKYKLSIITAHAFGVFVKPRNIFNYGINNLSREDILFAKEKGATIKLVAKSKKINGSLCAWVIPQIVPASHKLHNIDYEYNGVIVEGAFSDKQFFVGKGAGSYPTGSAVLSDISALTYNYKYEYKKFHQKLKLKHTNEFLIEIYLRYNDSSILDNLDFETIEESYTGRNFNYVIGKINLSHLIKYAELLNSPDIFIAQTANEEIILLNEKKEIIAVNRKQEYNCLR